MNDKSPLIEAQEKFLDAVLLRAMETESCDLPEALGRTLYANLLSPEDSPPYDRAIVEGFLVRAADTADAGEEHPRRFRIVGAVAPGDAECPDPGKDEAIEVATGSLLPEGEGYAVVRMWEAQREGDEFTITRPFPPGFFIEERGCDIERGRIIIEAGTVLAPRHLGIAASLGIATLEVSRQPRVAVFASGDEVIPHTAPIRPGTIRDCNTVQLMAAVTETGGMPQSCGIMGDDFDTFLAVLEEVIDDTDMIVISGGTAVGGRDFVSDLIRELGELIVDGVPMKSGRPMIAGIARNKPVVAVAGHPPEALRGFYLFGAPAIRRLMGQPVEPPPDRLF